jgi:conjugative transfer signal peptidase TraF
MGRMTIVRRSLWRAAWTIAAAALLWTARLNRSPSLPRGLYLQIPHAWQASPPARGDLVLACAPPPAAELARRRGYLGDGPCAAGTAGGAQPLGKLVLAVGGDDIALDEAGLSVNGRPVAGSRPLARDTLGRSIAHQPFGHRRLGPGQLWLFAPYHPRSYDSRYFGPVAAAAVRGRLLPVLIANDDRFPGFRLHRFHLSVLPAAAATVAASATAATAAATTVVARTAHAATAAASAATAPASATAAAAPTAAAATAAATATVAATAAATATTTAAASAATTSAAAPTATTAAPVPPQPQ